MALQPSVNNPSSHKSIPCSATSQHLLLHHRLVLVCLLLHDTVLFLIFIKAHFLTLGVQMHSASPSQRLDSARFLAARVRLEIQARRVLSVKPTLHPLEQMSLDSNRVQQQILFSGVQVHLARTNQQHPLLVPPPAPVSRSFSVIFTSSKRQQSIMELPGHHMHRSLKRNPIHL